MDFRSDLFIKSSWEDIAVAELDDSTRRASAENVRGDTSDAIAAAPTCYTPHHPVKLVVVQLIQCSALSE